MKRLFFKQCNIFYMVGVGELIDRLKFLEPVACFKEFLDVRALSEWIARNVYDGAGLERP